MAYRLFSKILQWIAGVLIGTGAVLVLPMVTRVGDVGTDEQPWSVGSSCTPANACITSQDDRSRHENLLEYLRALVRKGDLPAAAAATSHCSLLSFYSATAGVRRRWGSRNATALDFWHLGSNTKSMTATVLAMLIQDGLLGWDSTLGELLPDIKMLPQYITVNISDLTSHHSGLTDDHITSVLARSYAWNATEGRQQVSTVALAHPSTSTRGNFSYSNVNYVLGGLVIDRLAGTTAEQAFVDRIFTPLALKDPGFGPLPEGSFSTTCQPWPHLAFSRRFGRLFGAIPFFGMVKYRDSPPALNTAGRVHMRMWQYVAYLSEILSGAQGREMRQLGLTTENAETLNTPVGIPDASGCRRTFGGWRRCEDDDNRGFVLMHDGSNTRYYAHAVVDPAANRTYAAFTNRGDDTAKEEMHTLMDWMRKGMYWLDDAEEQDSNRTTQDPLIEEL